MWSVQDRLSLQPCKKIQNYIHKGHQSRSLQYRRWTKRPENRMAMSCAIPIMHHISMDHRRRNWWQGNRIRTFRLFSVHRPVFVQKFYTSLADKNKFEQKLGAHRLFSHFIKIIINHHRTRTVHRIITLKSLHQPSCRVDFAVLEKITENTRPQVKKKSGKDSWGNSPQEGKLLSCPLPNYSARTDPMCRYIRSC